MTCFIYDGGRRPVRPSAKDPISGITNPAQNYLVYTDPATAGGVSLTTADDNGNTIDSFAPEVRHGWLVADVGEIRFIPSGGTVTTAIGIPLTDGEKIQFVNQPELLHTLKFLKVGANATVYFFPEA